MIAARRQATNAVALVASGAAAKLLAFGTALLLFKRLGVAENGVYWLAIGLGFIVATVTEVGVRGYLVRELARRKDDAAAASDCWRDTLAARAALGMAGLVLAGPVLALMGYGGPVWVPVMALTVYALLDSMAMLFKFALRAYERMGLEAALSTAGRLIVLGSVAAMAMDGALTLREVVVAHLLGAGLESAAAALAVRFVLGLPILHKPRWDQAWAVAKASVPFAVVNVAGILYLKTGFIALSQLADDEAVARFGAATRIPEAMLFLPMGLIGAVVPHLSRNHGSTETVRKYFNFLVRYILAVGVVLALVFGLVPEGAILLLATPEYLSAAAAFRWLGLWAVFSFIHMVAAHMLIALNQEKWVMQRYLLALTLNIGLNLALTPWLGLTGAAAALCASEAVGTALDLARLRTTGITLGPAAFTLAALAATAAGAAMLLPWEPVPRALAAAAAGAIALIMAGAWRDRRTIVQMLRPSDAGR